MQTLREAAQQALEALEKGKNVSATEWHQAIAALRAALAEQAQPVAWKHRERREILDTDPREWGRADEPWTPLYTSPPAPQPLTDEELDVMWRSPMSADWEHREYGRLVEAEVLKRMGAQ